MASEHRQSVSQRIPTVEHTKMRVLTILDQILISYQQTLIGIQKISFAGYIDSDEDLIEGMVYYISAVISLYTMLKPKIKTQLLQGKTSFRALYEIDNYVNEVDELASSTEHDFDKLIKIFKVFHVFEDDLRDLCEELGYTSDVPAESMQ